MTLPLRRVLPRAAPPPPYPAFLVNGLVVSLTVGVLSGAINLYNLHARGAPVPVDHHRAHAFAQLFGLMGMTIVGVSFHLVPRFFGAAPPALSTVRLTKWAAIAGLWLLVVGRLGRLLPGSAWLGVTGATLLVVMATAWAAFIARLWLEAVQSPDALQPFLVAGTAWWWLATLLVLAWQLGQLTAGPLAAFPLEPVYAAALFGGTASWLWGIFLRAGGCTLRVERASPAAQRPAFVAWQLATALAVVAPFARSTAWTGAAAVALGAAMLVFVGVVRPFRRAAGALPDEALVRRAVQLGLGFGVVFALLSMWSGLSSLGLLGARPFLADATRHAFTLGCATLLVVGFVGRMVPSFEDVVLPRAWLYDAGVVALVVSAAARLASLFAPARLALAVSGVSGFVALAGVVAFSTCVVTALVRGRALRRTSPGPLMPLGVPTSRGLAQHL